MASVKGTITFVEGAVTFVGKGGSTIEGRLFKAVGAKLCCC